MLVLGAGQGGRVQGGPKGARGPKGQQEGKSHSQHGSLWAGEKDPL